MHGKQPSGRPVRQSSRSNATAKPPSWWSAKLLWRSSVRRHGTHATLPGRLANKSLFAAEAYSVRARQRDALRGLPSPACTGVSRFGVAKSWDLGPTRQVDDEEAARRGRLQ